MAESKKQPKVIGGINFSTRSKSASFWLGTVASIGTFIVSMGGLLGIDGLENIVNQGTAIAGVVVSILTQLGVLVDANTKGVKDSGIVQTDYTKPRDSKDPEQAVQFEAKGATFTPKEYDTREDFSDDSDEVDFHSTIVDGGEHPDEAKHLEDEEQPEDDTDEGLGQREVAEEPQKEEDK